MKQRYAHELKVGDTYDSFEFTATADLNEQFLFAVDDYNPLFTEGREGKPALVHPVVLMQMSPRTRSPSFRQAPGMGSALARDTSTALAPVYVGDRLRIDWNVTETYEKRGKIYQDYVATITNQSGEIVLRREMSSTFFTVGKVKTYALEEKA